MKSPIKWVGGKSKLANILLPMFPEHKGYVEVFGGAGHMLFSKEPAKRWEILNDFDGELMNFWSVIKNHKYQFMHSFEYTLVSRELFNEYKEIFKNKSETDCIKRAHIFYYLVKAGFGADLSSPCFGTAKDRSRLRLEQIEEDINQAYLRLLKVTIENDDFRNIIKRYDSSETFFYFDPPYRKTKEYKVKFNDNDYRDLADMCKNIQGKFLLTINDDVFIREIFKDFIITDHEVYYGICKDQNGRQNFKELIITNYNIT